jgi:DNA-binding NarL/FixJ family response regulator
MSSTEQDAEYLKTMTVLYVEDNDELREQLAEYLGRLVGQLFTAHNGAVGLDIFREKRPQMVITDLLMPVMQGLEMAAEIRKLDEYVPIVVVTAFERIDYLMRSIEIGVDKYVTKPIVIEQLRAALLTSAHRLRAEEQLNLHRQRKTARLMQTQEELSIEVEHRNVDLMEANVTLKVLLKAMEAAKGEFEEKVATKIFELVSPYLDKLKTSGLNPQQSEHLAILTTNLEDIAAAGSQTNGSMARLFTPTEVKIANLIKKGRSTKEIASLLNLSPRTIDKNRQNIRKKIGITNRKTNLSALLSTTPDL